MKKMAGKKLGKRAFINRLKALGSGRWITGNLYEYDDRGYEGDSDSENPKFFCDLGWMGHVHGMDVTAITEDDVVYKLEDIYDIDPSVLRNIPIVNDSSGTFEDNLKAVELLLSGRLPQEIVDAIDLGNIAVEDVLDDTEAFKVWKWQELGEDFTGRKAYYMDTYGHDGERWGGIGH
jgi:hypothetical protein